jgi:hypothetical protein
MSEKEINPLKRGRIQKQSRGQKKKTILGEISDPFTVLNDSIATKNYQQNSIRNDYIPSEKIDRAKTTTVDAINPLLDPDHPPREKINETRPFQNGKRGLRRDSRCSESSPSDGNRPSHDEIRRNGNRIERNRRNESSFEDSRPQYDETRRNGNRSEEWIENPPEQKSKCGLKCLLNKILSLLHLGSHRNKSCGCHRKNNQGNEVRRCRTDNRCANARGGRNRFRPSQNKSK